MSANDAAGGKGHVRWTIEQAELLDVGAGASRDAQGFAKLDYVAVLADAGSGKTSVLVERVRRVLGLKDSNAKTVARPGTSLRRILCLSFTEKSAADLKSRLLGFNEVDVFTIHAFCARVLREFGPKFLGLSPLWHVMDEIEAALLLEKSFHRVLRRTKKIPQGFSSAQIFAVIKTALHANGPEQIQLRGGDPEQSEIFEAFIANTLMDFKRAKARKGALSYDDLEQGALQLSHHEEVKDFFLARYSHLFIDEFQDTSQSQALFLKQLFDLARNPRAQAWHPRRLNGLFVVGDEKQSIYRFRGADVSVFRDFIAPLEQRRLSFNFRSHPRIIDAVNAVSSLSLRDFTPATSGLSGETAGSVAFLSSPEAGIFTALKYLQGKDVNLESTVLLMPRLSGAEKKLNFLQGHEIVYSLQASGGLLFHPQLSKIANLWISLASPHDDLRKLRASVDFRASILNNINLSQSALLLDWLRALLAAGVFGEFGIQFLQFWTLIARETEKGSTPRGLAQQWLKIQKMDLDVAGAKAFAPPPFMKGVLRVMTVHASKGLEFPAVILADIRGKKNISRALALRVGQELHIPHRGDDGEWERADEFENAKAVEQELETAESARLLYVAMTRAENELVVVDENPEQKAQASTPWVNWLREGLSAEFGVEANSIAAGPASAASIESCDGTKTRPVSSSLPSGHLDFFDPLLQQKPNYHRARTGVTAWLQEQKKAFGSAGENVILDNTSETPSSFVRPSDVPVGKPSHAKAQGIALHSIFERARSRVLLASLLNQGDFQCPEFFDWLDTQEGGALFPEYAQNPEAGIKVFREFPLEWGEQAVDQDGIARSAPEVLVGRIDRLVVDERRKLITVVDYKWIPRVGKGFAALEKNIPSAASARLRQRYALQVATYANALMHCAEFRGFEFRGCLLDVACSTGIICHCVFP